MSVMYKIDGIIVLMRILWRLKTDTQKLKKDIFRCFKICSRPIGNLFQSFDYLA